MSKQFAVLGHPIAHSLSPAIHTAFATQFDLPIAYDKMDVAPDRFRAFWHSGEGRSLTGANVTFPLKRLAFELVDEVGEHALEAGAVNTIVRREDKLLGFNTDGLGLLTDLMQNLGVPINGRRLLLIGAGGAARGILGPLLRHVPNQMVIANRTLSNAETIFEKFRAQVQRIDGLGMCVSTLEDLGQAGSFEGIINATSLGHGDVQLDLPKSILQQDTWCYDLSYGDAAKPFTDWAKSKGCEHVHDGLGMLVEQAAESFRLWHQLSPRTQSVRQQLAAATGNTSQELT